MTFSKLKIIIQVIHDGIRGLRMNFFSSRRDRYGYIAPSSQVSNPIWGPKQNVFIYDNCGINGHVKFLCTNGKFTMKKNCSVGAGLTVITSNHQYDKVGQYPEGASWEEQYSYDVIVNEDVWIGANVTLCPGAIIGRGCIIAAGSVCIQGKEYPPYSIIGGNPAQFIKFRLSLDDQIEQEKYRFDESERLPINALQSNWIKFPSQK